MNIHSCSTLANLKHSHQVAIDTNHATSHHANRARIKILKIKIFGTPEFGNRVHCGHLYSAMKYILEHLISNSSEVTEQIALHLREC
jgi:hypothetical protein